MSDFFKSWRRRFGVMTLLAAVVIAAGWIRSFLVHDFIKFDCDFNQGALAGIVTAQNSLNVMAYEMSVAGVDFGDSLPMQVHDLSQMFPFLAPAYYESTATLFVVNQNAASTTPVLQSMPVLVIPFWSIVIPLTLLSTWLLLSNPRKPCPQPNLPKPFKLREPR